MDNSMENFKKIKKVIYIDISKGGPITDESVDIKDKKVLLVSTSKNSGKCMSKAMNDFILDAVDIKTSVFYEKNDLMKFDIVIFDELPFEKIKIFSANHDFSNLKELVILVDSSLYLPKVRSTIDFGDSWDKFAGKDIEYKVVKRQNPQEKILNIKSLKD